ncbi:MAG: hypothetical protein Q8865_08880 [Bacillota bacterium]|nr:hypothetical protein [Bacillota bacterium]
MALYKELIDNKGQTTKYHRIQAVAQVYNGSEENVQINLAGYADTQYRETEKAKPDNSMIVSSTAITLSLDDSKGYTREALYARIKAEVAEFADAQDC